MKFWLDRGACGFRLDVIDRTLNGSLRERDK